MNLCFNISLSGSADAAGDRAHDKHFADIWQIRMRPTKLKVFGLT